MVELTCEDCQQTQDFPSTLTVVDELDSGWELEVEVHSNTIRVTNAYCPSCQ